MNDALSWNDRRTHDRLTGQFPLQLRSREAIGVLERLAVATNISRGGLYTRLIRPVGVGDQMFGVVTLPTGSAFAGRGHVVRLEQLAGLGWGIAVRFTSARLLSTE